MPCRYSRGVRTKRPKSTNGGSDSPISIHAVADAAGVSIATVSRVMNAKHMVSAKTAERVLKVIQETGYVPNPFAHGLSKRETRVLGITLPDIHGEFYSELLRGANAQAHALGYHLLISSSVAHSATSQNVSAFRRGIAAGLVDGIAIMLTEPDEDIVQMLAKSNIPVVAIDFVLHEKGIDSVVVDNTPGTAQAVEHLLSSVAPDRLYFVGGPADNFDTKERAETFKTTLARVGHRMKSGQASYGTYTLQWGQQWARSACKSALLKGAGVLAGNDEIACGIMQAAEDAGLKVPQDLRIVGFDDTRMSALVRPRLSTVHVPMSDVGSGAIRALVKRLENRDAKASITLLPTRLIIRESSSLHSDQ